MNNNFCNVTGAQQTPIQQYVSNAVDNQMMVTNKWVVTSLQEALNKFAPPNSRGIYYSQDGVYEYEIYTDANGIKSYDTYKRILCTKEQSMKPVTQADIAAILEKIERLEGKHNDTATNIADDTPKVSG